MSHPNSYIAYRFEELGGQLKRAEIAWKDPEEGQIVAKVLACGVCARLASSYPICDNGVLLTTNDE